MNTIDNFPVERILFQNEACLVINKLPGESSENPITGNGGDKFPAPVHRLDTPVSGCLLYARTREAAAFLGAAFAKNAEHVLAADTHFIEKRYWAIVEIPADEISERLGENTKAEAELVHWLYENKKLNKSFALPWKEGNAPHRRNCAPPKKAILRYRIIGKGDRYLFLEAALVTGRHHQIRAQLAAIGLRIKGDLKYGARRSEKTGCIRLHAFSLSFPNPLNSAEIIHVRADPPLDDSLWQAFTAAKMNTAAAKITGA